MSDKHSYSHTTLKRKEKVNTSPFQKSLSYAYSNLRSQEAQEVQPVSQCLQHSIENTHLCFNCLQFICSACLNDKKHKQHEVKVIDKAIAVIEHYLQEYSIRLESKNELMSLLIDQIHNNRNEQYKESKVYKESLDNLFGELIQKLTERKQQLFQQIDQAIHSYYNQAQSLMVQIKKNQDTFYKISKQIKEQLEKRQNGHTFCHYYCSKKQHIDKCAQEAEITSYKESIKEARWIINSSNVQQLFEDIQNINLQYELIPTNFPSKRMLTKTGGESKKQLKKVSRLNDWKEQKATDWEGHTLTPKENRSKSRKNESKDKREGGLKRKDRKSSCKMVSMPVSPLKDKKETFPLFDKPKKRCFKKKS